MFGRPIMSLRTGTRIGTAQEPIIDPRNLKVLGWWCQGLDGNKQDILLSEDVREQMPSGLAVNDESALSTPDDLVRHQEVLNIRFMLLDKLVKNKHQKLGKVNDFAYDESMFIQKLYVARSLIKVFSSQDTLIIDRVQIIEVSDKYILVDEADVKANVAESVPAGAATASS